jgi:indolepyruvate ferredoxin oxidoreductase
LSASPEQFICSDRIRGYGPVKEKAVEDAQVRYAQLAADLANPPPAPRQIAAE